MKDMYALDPNATYVVHMPSATEPKVIESMRELWESQTSAKVIFMVGVELVKLRGEQS